MKISRESVQQSLRNLVDIKREKNNMKQRKNTTITKRSSIKNKNKKEKFGKKDHDSVSIYTLIQHIVQSSFIDL